MFVPELPTGRLLLTAAPRWRLAHSDDPCTFCKCRSTHPVGFRVCRSVSKKTSACLVPVTQSPSSPTLWRLLLLVTPADIHSFESSKLWYWNFMTSGSFIRWRHFPSPTLWFPWGQSTSAKPSKPQVSPCSPSHLRVRALHSLGSSAPDEWAVFSVLLWTHKFTSIWCLPVHGS